MKRVRVNNLYPYKLVLLDRCHPPYNVREGAIVRVVNLPGCPKAGMMGHCHVEHLNGDFAGLVCSNSLEDFAHQSAKQVKGKQPHAALNSGPHGNRKSKLAMSATWNFLGENSNDRTTRSRWLLLADERCGGPRLQPTAGPQPPLRDLVFLAWLRSYFVGAPSFWGRRPCLPFQEVRRNAP
jgi:hypothetical protein